MVYFYAIYNSKLPFVLLILAIVSAATAQTTFEPGKETRLDAGKSAGEILVYVPGDYNDDCNWPAIYYYHGKGGQLSTQWLQIATGGKGYIIVSLEFVPTASEQLNQVQYRAYIAQEIKNFGYVRHFLQGKLKTDFKKTVLAGLSRGGWLVADLFSVRPQLAAAAVITAAGYHNWLPENASPMTGKYVYIGAGEKDQNLEPAKKAARYFANRSANVMLEIYPGLGHQIDPNAPKLQKWFSDLRSNLNDH
ncbi:MAG: hypothetical protein ABSE89_01970 [Sedimentisphaerales bacterium]